MILKRRDKPSFWYRAREFVAPRKGMLRGVDYLSKRMRRLPDSPHRIALGFACGAMASFTPFFAFHFFVAAGIAWLVRGNIIASLFGTAVGNPFTFPLISTTSLYLGRWIMGRGDEGSTFDVVMDSFADAFKSTWGTMKSWFGYGPSRWDGLVQFFHDVFVPYLVGGLIPGLLAGTIFYAILLPVVSAYQNRRRSKLALIRQQRESDSPASGAAFDEVAGD
ncbi:MAG: DUF2062 domain-containing protein [Pseudomonadota bacterium]